MHCGVLGGSGSGKTTLAMNIIEQTLARGIPALLVDRKGDLARYADPEAWQQADERHAERRALRERLDIALFTPGHRGGRPLRLTLVPDIRELGETERQQQFRTGAQALGDLLNLKGSAADEAKRALLLKGIEVVCRLCGSATVQQVAELLERQDPTFVQEVGVLGKQIDPLIMQPKSFELMNPELLVEDGEPLDAGYLLGLGPYAVPGRVRLAIVSTRLFDGEAPALIWVAELLGELNGFAGAHPSATLQAIVMFDEADIYLPATRQPVTKQPMESLLKRSRSAGLGVMLATQSPGDLDYKCKENVLTWFVGKVKERRAHEKLRPLCESAGIDPTKAFPKQSIGQFHLLNGSGATAIESNRSLIETEQLPEQKILELARGTASDR